MATICLETYSNGRKMHCCDCRHYHRDEDGRMCCFLAEDLRKDIVARQSYEHKYRGKFGCAPELGGERK